MWINADSNDSSDAASADKRVAGAEVMWSIAKDLGVGTPVKTLTNSARVFHDIDTEYELTPELDVAEPIFTFDDVARTPNKDGQK